MRLPPTQDVRPPDGYEETTLVVGNIVGICGTNRVNVRLGGIDGGRVLRNVVIAEGVDFQADDRVLVGRLSDKIGFVAITKVLDTPEHGIAVSAILRQGGMHPPTGFTAEGFHGLIVASWEGWTGDTLCFQVQHNSSAAESGATTWYTRGSHCLYRVGKEETRHFRVRSIRYDVKSGHAYYSGWSDWSSATSVGIDHLMALLESDIDYELTMHVVHGV